MQVVPQLEPEILFPRPTVSDSSGSSFDTWLERTDQPDVLVNPKLWRKLFYEGLTLHARSLGCIRRAGRILDLGCGGGWFAIAAARFQPQATVEAIDRDAGLIAWGRAYATQHAKQGKKMGEVSFVAAEIETYPWHLHEEEFDLVHAGFILSRVRDPGAVLQGIYGALRPGGWLIYHDAMEAPVHNLERLARLQHFFAKWTDMTSDLWNWRRRWCQRYTWDVVRTLARREEPTEAHVFGRLEELFALRYQERRRAFIDSYLGKSGGKFPKNLLVSPALKILDDVLVRTGVLEGACRYALAQKR